MGFPYCDPNKMYLPAIGNIEEVEFNKLDGYTIYGKQTHHGGLRAVACSADISADADPANAVKLVRCDDGKWERIAPHCPKKNHAFRLQIPTDVEARKIKFELVSI